METNHKRLEHYAKESCYSNCNGDPSGGSKEVLQALGRLVAGWEGADESGGRSVLANCRDVCTISVRH